MNTILLYLGAFLTAAWGIAHLFPTRNVVRGFGEISADNKKIITMEWIIEGATLIFLGVLTALTTYAEPYVWLAKLVFIVTALFLVVLSVISFFTGFRVAFFPYKLCPFIFLSSAVLIFLGGIYLAPADIKEHMRNAYINEVIATEKAFADMAAKEGVKEAFLYYAADSAVLNRNNEIFKGKEELAAHFDSMALTDVVLEWAPEFVDVSPDGELAYTYGKFVFSATGPDGKKLEADGIFHTVWKKQADGSWKFVYD
jgi:ketosteroid isomerase-like protein